MIVENQVVEDAAVGLTIKLCACGCRRTVTGRGRYATLRCRPQCKLTREQIIARMRQQAAGLLRAADVLERDKPERSASSRLL